MDMDISMDIHRESVDMDMDMDGKFHIHGKPEYLSHAESNGSRMNIKLLTEAEPGLSDWREIGVGADEGHNSPSAGSPSQNGGLDH